MNETPVFQAGVPFSAPDTTNVVHVVNLTFAGGNVVHEPGTWTMLIAGFGVVGAAASRRRKLASAT